MPRHRGAFSRFAGRQLPQGFDMWTPTQQKPYHLGHFSWPSIRCVPGRRASSRLRADSAPAARLRKSARAGAHLYPERKRNTCHWLDRRDKGVPVGEAVQRSWSPSHKKEAAVTSSRSSNNLGRATDLPVHFARRVRAAKHMGTICPKTAPCAPPCSPIALLPKPDSRERMASVQSAEVEPQAMASGPGCGRWRSFASAWATAHRHRVLHRAAKGGHDRKPNSCKTRAHDRFRHL